MGFRKKIKFKVDHCWKKMVCCTHGKHVFNKNILISHQYLRSCATYRSLMIIKSTSILVVIWILWIIIHTIICPITGEKHRIRMYCSYREITGLQLGNRFGKLNLRLYSRTTKICPGSSNAFGKTSKANCLYSILLITACSFQVALHLYRQK